MNKVILCGRLTRDPEVRFSAGENQTCIARYVLAVDRRMQRQEGEDQGQTADFVQCVAFGRAAEFADKYLKQGTKIMISGRIQTGAYTDREGRRVYTTDVIVEESEFAESKKDQTAAPYTSSKTKEEPKEQKTDPEGFMQFPEGINAEGLPFN